MKGLNEYATKLETGTAILIIYSCFAAIYYSKVNPLVSDYDYTDYLGGARSLSGGDLDFVDDDGESQKKTPVSNWYKNILPKVGHSLEFILNAIDKVPVNDEHNNDQAKNDIDYEDINYENDNDSDLEKNYDSSEVTTSLNKE